MHYEGVHQYYVSDVYICEGHRRFELVKRVTDKNKC